MRKFLFLDLFFVDSRNEVFLGRSGGRGLREATRGEKHRGRDEKCSAQQQTETRGERSGNSAIVSSLSKLGPEHFPAIHRGQSYLSETIQVIKNETK